MDRQEPRFDKDEVANIEFRPRSYRGPSSALSRTEHDGLPWKIGVAVGVAVLIALLLFNAYERHQNRRDAELALKMLNSEMAKLEAESTRQLESLALQRQSVRQTTRRIRPIPPGYRCSAGVLLYREGSAWTQITSRSRHMYCPEGGGLDACYYVTPQSVGCST